MNIGRREHREINADRPDEHDRALGVGLRDGLDECEVAAFAHTAGKADPRRAEAGDLRRQRLGSGEMVEVDALREVKGARRGRPLGFPQLGRGRDDRAHLAEERTLERIYQSARNARQLSVIVHTEVDRRLFAERPDDPRRGRRPGDQDGRPRGSYMLQCSPRVPEQ